MVVIPAFHTGMRTSPWMSDRVVVCYFRSKEVARHARIQTKGAYRTIESHMPARHQWFKDRERLLSAARDVGPHTEMRVQAVLERRTHPEQSFLSAKGILGLQQRYDASRLEAACTLALSLGARAHHYPSLSSILKTGRDQRYTKPVEIPAIVHKNLRGSSDYR